LSGIGVKHGGSDHRFAKTIQFREPNQLPKKQKRLAVEQRVHKKVSWLRSLPAGRQGRTADFVLFRSSVLDASIGALIRSTDRFCSAKNRFSSGLKRK